MTEATQNYVRIPLTQGKYAVINIEDLPEIGKYRWNAKSAGAYARLPQTEGGGLAAMHRKIMNPPEGMCVDHKDRNTLNNKRENLRVCSHAENMRNVKPIKSASGLKGVQRQNTKWVANIVINGKKLFLGTFQEKEDAFNAYKEASAKYHGEFGRVEETPFEDYSHIPIAVRANNRPVKSGFKGVYPSGDKWMAQVVIRGKRSYLGSFPTAQEAADKIKEFTEKTQ